MNKQMTPAEIELIQPKPRNFLGTMTNKHVPYVWRTNYCNDEWQSQNFLKIAHEKTRQYLSQAATSTVRRSYHPFGKG